MKCVLVELLQKGKAKDNIVYIIIVIHISYLTHEGYGNSLKNVCPKKVKI